MFRIPKNARIPKSKKERKEVDVVTLEKLQVFKERAKEDLNKIKITSISPVIPLDQYPISQKKSVWSDMPYGKASNIADAGCGPLALEYALRANGFNIDFERIVEEVVNKGYRAYIYDEQGLIVDGAGTEYSLFDNLGDRLDNLYQIFDCLSRGSSICILMQNSVYHEDDKRKGNHFITLIGIDDKKNAIFMDGNLIVDNNHPEQALVRKPFEKMALGFKAAWAWNREKLKTFVE